MLLRDKYRPKTLDNLWFNRDIAINLLTIGSDNDMPHIIMYGQKGSGKDVLIEILLGQLHGKYAYQARNVSYSISGPNNVTIDVTIEQGPFHIVIEPCNNSVDKIVVQYIIKEYIMTNVIDHIYHNNRNFKTIVINNAHNLSYYAQMSLRRTMEKHSDICRFIMLCDSLSKLILPLRSRCMCVRVPMPSSHDILSTALMICHNEKYSINLLDLSKIVARSHNNINMCMWLLEFKLQNIRMTSNVDIAIHELYDMIIEANLNRIHEIRTILYAIMATNIEDHVILEKLLIKLCSSARIPGVLKYDIISLAAKYDHNCAIGRKEIIHLDAFVVSVISLLINHVH